MSDRATKIPVTKAGWYEHNDGTWGRYNTVPSEEGGYRAVCEEITAGPPVEKLDTQWYIMGPSYRARPMSLREKNLGESDQRMRLKMKWMDDRMRRARRELRKKKPNIDKAMVWLDGRSAEVKRLLEQMEDEAAEE